MDVWLTLSGFSEEVWLLSDEVDMLSEGVLLIRPFPLDGN